MRVPGRRIAGEFREIRSSDRKRFELSDEKNLKIIFCA